MVVADSRSRCGRPVELAGVSGRLVVSLCVLSAGDEADTGRSIHDGSGHLELFLKYSSSMMIFFFSLYRPHLPYAFFSNHSL